MKWIAKRPLFFAALAAAGLGAVVASNVAAAPPSAANLRCGTPDPSLTKQTTIEARMMQVSRRQSATVTVPIYWHVINRGSLPTEGNVAIEDIQEQIAVLNEAYSGDAGGAETKFQFTLAGIDRTTNETWYFGVEDAAIDLEMKTALRQGGADALNIYSVRPNQGLLGRSSFPWDYAANPARDGILIRYSTLPNGVATPFNEGDTLVHEVGHWLGLFHTFWNKCAKKSDFVGDTPAQKYPSSGCPSGNDTCPGDDGNDPTENYMDYTDDSCMFEFTPGQAQRMGVAWDLFRAP